MAKKRIKTGERLKFFCKFCDAVSSGAVFRERYRWRARLDCGHFRNLGFVLPPEELERRGIINYEEERKGITPKQRMILDGQLELKEIEHREKKLGNLTRGKMYL